MGRKPEPEVEEKSEKSESKRDAEKVEHFNKDDSHIIWHREGKEYHILDRQTHARIRLDDEGMRRLCLWAVKQGVALDEKESERHAERS